MIEAYVTADRFREALERDGEAWTSGHYDEYALSWLWRNAW